MDDDRRAGDLGREHLRPEAYERLCADAIAMAGPTVVEDSRRLTRAAVTVVGSYPETEIHVEYVDENGTAAPTQRFRVWDELQFTSSKADWVLAPLMIAANYFDVVLP